MHSFARRFDPGLNSKESTPCMTVNVPLPNSTEISLFQKDGKFLRVTVTVVPPTAGPVVGVKEMTDDAGRVLGSTHHFTSHNEFSGTSSTIFCTSAIRDILLQNLSYEQRAKYSNEKS